MLQLATSPTTPAIDRDAALLLRLRLARARGVGARAVAVIHELLGSLERFFELSPGELEARGVPPRIVAAGRDPALGTLAVAELARLRARGGDLLGLGLPGYPEALGAIHDPPTTLAIRGELRPEDARAVAVVGSRRASPTGLEVARTLGHELAAAGVTVVSGLARGVDQAAHQGALDAGGRTIAVLGSGVLNPYPPQNRVLAERIARSGALLSELEPDAHPSRHSFPQRNRIVVGLSVGVVVVEAGPRSGALITADLALQSGRELLAVPGSVLEPLARGPNRLIREGAHVVEHAGDVLDVLFGVAARAPDPDAATTGEGTEDEGTRGPPPVAPRDERAPPQERVHAALDARTARSLEALVQATGLPSDRVMVALGGLELAGRARPAGVGHVRC
jgi:DNA processing protein